MGKREVNYMCSLIPGLEPSSQDSAPQKVSDHSVLSPFLSPFLHHAATKDSA